MKTFRFLLVLSGILFSANTITAQYGNSGYGNGYGNNGNGYGSNRMSQMNHDTPEAPKVIPVEVTVSKIMEKIKPELNLDALQEIAIANVLIESLKAQGVIIKQESSQEDKMKDIQALSEVTDRKIMEFLDADQKVKYKLMNEESKTKRAKKH
ncbi:hypothetical protein [Flavobacterium restrictum]|uniref:Uncharacterized protein n=1 Tax=Flavobacterium restrictum TaxID=2594428 RepID=A0A553E8H4_9FLAO|nr:hypothetical protein [Flavobacterium restrictum]TRX41326.1 hypothetical protein FNW21_04300 [Flavobacterium restrictum]